MSIWCPTGIVLSLPLRDYCGTKFKLGIKKTNCIKRESNPRRVDGNDPGYHYPINAIEKDYSLSYTSSMLLLECTATSTQVKWRVYGLPMEQPPTTTWTGTAHPSCLCLIYTICFSEVVGRKRATLSSSRLDCPGYGVHVRHSKRSHEISVAPFSTISPTKTLPKPATI